MIQHLNKAFDHRIRLGIMSVLVVNEWVDFQELKRLLQDVTDGNLASHIKQLEKGAHIEVRKRFVGNKPNTSYRVTPLGRISFQTHLRALEKILKQSQG